MLLSNLRRLKRDSLFHLNDVKELEKNFDCVFSEDVENANALYLQAKSLFKEIKNKTPCLDDHLAKVEFLTLKLRLAELYGPLKEKCKKNNILFY